MEQRVHTFTIDLNWDLLALVSRIDRFDASWASIEKKEGQSLKQLKSIATVRSVGASTRIEGSNMTDEEVEVLLGNLEISKMEDRDSQEVRGYFEALDLVTESFGRIKINEEDIKNLHNLLLKHSTKDEWHKGDYKQHPNSVEATLADGTTQIIFETEEPGTATQTAMSELIDWYRSDKQTHAVIKCAVFAYDFVSIHPFQDGNGRLSRLISSLLLLKNGYNWIQFVSFEHEIESRKSEYYRVLRSCQSNRPNESVNEWVNFFLTSLLRIQEQLLDKLEVQGVEAELSPRERSIVVFIGNNPGCKSGEIARKLGIPSPTVKRMLPALIELGFIEKHGSGPGTNYSVV